MSAFSAYPVNRRWNPGRTEEEWTPPLARHGGEVEWYAAHNAGPHYPGRPQPWTQGEEREGLIGSILDLQSWRRFDGEPMTAETLARWSTAKLEFVADQMLLAAADGRAAPRTGSR